MIVERYRPSAPEAKLATRIVHNQPTDPLRIPGREQEVSTYEGGGNPGTHSRQQNSLPSTMARI
jgi:hypothetical protein